MVFDLAHHRKRCGLRSGVCSPFHAGHGHAQERTNWKCERALQSASEYWREHRNIRCQHLGDPSFTNTPLGLVPLFDTQPRAPAWSLHTSGTGTLSRRPSSRPTSSIRQVSERVRHTGYCLFLRRRIAVYRNRLFALCAYHFRGSQRQGEERRSCGCTLARNPSMAEEQQYLEIRDEIQRLRDEQERLRDQQEELRRNNKSSHNGDSNHQNQDDTP